ncbi:MAG: DNA helicase RecG, partial [bacterium]|nr:DNA helicase RecG [bacterium]
MVSLDTPVESFKGVGPAVKKQLKNIGIETCKDLIFYFPYRFDDFSDVISIKDLKPSTHATVSGKIQLINSRRAVKRRMVITEA